MFVFDLFSYIVSFFSLVDDIVNLMASGGLLQFENFFWQPAIWDDAVQPDVVQTDDLQPDDGSLLFYLL
jgi:hypothetical protein